MPDLGDAEQVSKRDVAIVDREKREAERFSQVLHSYAGREFVWNLLNYCKIFHAAPLDQEEIVRFEGRRDVGLHILGKCFTYSMETYNLMQQEAQKRDSEENNVAKEHGG